MNFKFTKHLAYMALICSTVTAQTGRKVIAVTKDLVPDPKSQTYIDKRGCATAIPDAQWESQFQQLIAQFQQDQANNRVQANYTIPVVIHIIHGGQAVGTFPNISNAQAVSQINVLNNDFAGTGLNVGNYPATAFTAYATAAALPAANKDANGRVKISNFNVSFCLATIDKNGNAMSEAGIDRINYNSISTPTSATYPTKNPAAANYNSPSTFMSFIDGYIKPATIWDPTKYMNIWVTDENASTGLLGYATFPAASGLTGISGVGTATTDGLWCWGKCFGNTGTLDPTYNRGRTATHEIGHWIGLRHIWGDGVCATDYCLDTPPQQSENYTAGAYPLNANSCTSPTGVNNTIPNGANGEMFMNFMDYVPDVSMYMFTEDQRTRAQTAMANGTYRKFLGTHGLCAVGSPTPAVAAFTMTNSACNGVAVSVSNNSTGNPTPTYTWSASPSAGVVFSPNANSTSPTITFTNNGSYVITLAAQSGTTAVSTKTNAITIATCTTPAVCSATITNVAASDTMYVGAAGADTQTSGCSPKAGYVFGSNCYDDKEKASFFAPSTYSMVTPGPAWVTGAVVVFYKSGTAGTTGTASRSVNLKMYNGDLTNGPTGTTGIATATANIGLIGAATATNNIGYLAGDPNVTYATAIARPYKYTFSSPIQAPAGGFYLAVTTPTTAGDTAVILNDFHATTNTSWEMWTDNTWHDMNVAWGGLVNNMSIFPILTCATKVGEYSPLSNNINILPNPSNGMFNILMTLPNAQDITIDVTNTLGQTVYYNNYKSFTDGMVAVDMSAQNQGIYFVTISNGKEKSVQRVVITK
jgi:hypothetical protein